MGGKGFSNGTDEGSGGVLIYRVSEMDVQIIALWIGLFITFILGLFNFLWGGSLLSRRQKVIIREPELKTSVMGEHDRIERIFIQSSFKLVRTRGEQDLYLESASLQLSKARCEELSAYFMISAKACIYRKPIAYHNIGEAEYKILGVNVPREFEIWSNFTARSSVQILMNELQQAGNDEERKEKLKRLEDLKEKVKKLETKYMIIWVDGKGDERRYRFPSKWYNKFLSERLWWKLS